MKKCYAIIFLFIFSVMILLVNDNSFATEQDNIEQGNSLLQKIEDNENPELNSMYVQNALYEYYVASKKNPPSTESLVGLGRVYMFMDKYDDAKNALFKAYSLDKYNAEANFYFAEFFYKYGEYEPALKYYKNAYSLGYSNSKLIDMITKCYNKLGDTQGVSDFTLENKN